MKVLLTGATGFIGSHVARQLTQAGHEVRAVVRAGTDLRGIADIGSAIGFIKGDLLEPSFIATLPGCDLCLHLAWYVEPGQYLTSPKNLDHVTATLRLAQRMAASGCGRFVGAGSCFEYDVACADLHEDAPTRPRSIYSACKLAAFTVLKPYCEACGMSFAWVRLFYQYGPYEDPRRLLPYIIKSLLLDRRAELTRGEQIRDFLHIEDVAAAICAVARSHLAGPVNIGSGRPVSVAEAASLIGELIGKPALIALGARPYPPGEPMRVVADNARLHSGTGWRPRFGFDDGLRRTIDWWRTRMP